MATTYQAVLSESVTIRSFNGIAIKLPKGAVVCLPEAVSEESFREAAYVAGLIPHLTSEMVVTEVSGVSGVSGVAEVAEVSGVAEVTKAAPKPTKAVPRPTKGRPKKQK